MISFTENAAAKVKSMMEKNGDPNQRLRIYVESGGCSGLEYGMSFDQVKEGDRELENRGIPYLVDETSLTHLDGSEVDFDDGLNGKGFEVRNPNAKSTCGCGRSFQ